MQVPAIKRGDKASRHVMRAHQRQVDPVLLPERGKLARSTQDRQQSLQPLCGSQGSGKPQVVAAPVHSSPTQRQIDDLGGGKTISDWEARFELAYQKCKDENVTLVGGVAPTATRFARYLWQKHRVYPKDLWKTQVVTLGSVPGINTRYRPALRALYGPVAIRETCGGATECMFGQQRDERKAWVPNYDLFLFEVETRSGIKMLHEMRPGETGSMIVSTPVLARYY